MPAMTHATKTAQVVSPVTQLTAQSRRQGAALAPPTSGIAFADRAGAGGLPAALRAGIAALSGLDLGAVRVHLNSPQPAQRQALAYTQGAEIHIAPGQERHLPHEAWHAVQQAQGRVRPTRQFKLAGLNDDAGLEHEADAMGQHALQAGRSIVLGDAPAKLPAVPSALSNPIHGNTAAAVQRYSDVGGGTRYSENHQIMLLNKQSLWAQAGSIRQANLALAAKGAYVKLEPTGLVIDSAFGGQLHEVAPRWNAGKKISRGDRERIRLAEANAQSNGFVTHADCFMNAQTVMGVADSPVGVSNTTHPLVGQGQSRGVVKEISQTDMTDKFGGTGLASTLGGGSPSRGHYAFVLHVFPHFFNWLHSAPVQTTALKGAADLFCAAFETYSGQRNKQGLDGLLRAYVALSRTPAYAALKDGFSRMFAVNEYLSPEVGEGLAVLNDPQERKTSQDQIERGTRHADAEIWNYHFAGVVMKDGADYVTLENYSVGDVEVDNRLWLFQMYGSGAQSFHAEMAHKPGISPDSGLTLGFSSQKPTIL